MKFFRVEALHHRRTSYNDRKNGLLRLVKHLVETGVDKAKSEALGEVIAYVVQQLNGVCLLSVLDPRCAFLDHLRKVFFVDIVLPNVSR